MNKNFLAHKSFHTGTKRNIEKVWKAEEQQKAEERKISELRKQIEEERQIEELQKVMRDSGYSGKEERVEWIYQAPVGRDEKTTEEYLLGKAVTTLDLKQGGSEKEQMSKIGLDNYKPVSAQQDVWQRMHEDPLLEIKRRQQEQLELLKKNPLQMKRLRKKLEEEKKAKKKEKKKRKKERKERKEKKRKREKYDSREDSASYEEKNVDKKSEDSKIHLKEGTDLSNFGLQFPNGAPIKLEREEREEKEESEEKKEEKPERKKKKKLSEKELEERRREMERDAEQVDKFREERIKESIKREKEEGKTQGKPGETATFIKEANKNLYLGGEETMADRLKRNAYFRQK